MIDSGRADLINDFLGSAHVLVSTVSEVIEKRLLRETLGDRLTHSQLKLLKLVGLADAQTIGDVAAFLGVSDPAASKAVDKLVREMLMRRTEAEDRRAISLSLTAAGRRLLALYETARSQKLMEIFEKLPAEELHRVAEFLDQLSAHIVESGPAAEELCLQCGIYFREKCLIRTKLSRKCLYQRHRGRPTLKSTPAGGRSV